VYANTEASGTFDIRLAEDANRRMEKAGVTLMGFFAIVCDLMRDWRNTPGLTQLLPFLDQYVCCYCMLCGMSNSSIGTSSPMALLRATMLRQLSTELLQMLRRSLSRCEHHRGYGMWSRIVGQSAVPWGRAWFGVSKMA
jgi:hypothetical protein